jgi:hypothetical protein
MYESNLFYNISFAVKSMASKYPSGGQPAVRVRHVPKDVIKEFIPRVREQGKEIFRNLNNEIQSLKDVSVHDTL